MDNKQYCIILAGGKGRRLWPCSREKNPKQFIDFFGSGRTQLQQTYDRFTKILPQENIFITTAKEYVELVKEQLPDMNADNILAEPVSRGTAPAVLWANMRICRQCADANVVITPSDQFVLNEEAFQHNIEEGFRFVEHHQALLTIGITPTRPEPGYGYIQMGDAMEGATEVFRVKSFTEKPDRDFAKVFMESGEFLWNTGLIQANGHYLNSCFRQLFPDVMKRLDAVRPNFTLEDELEFVSENYPSYANLSIDRGLLERCDEVCVMHGNFGWADLGTWHAIYECRSRGEGDNVVVDSEVILDESHNNVIKLPKGRLGIVSGLDGYIVAEEDNVLLIYKKGDSSALVRKYVNEVQMKYGDEFV